MQINSTVMKEQSGKMQCNHVVDKDIYLIKNSPDSKLWHTHTRVRNSYIKNWLFARDEILWNS